MLSRENQDRHKSSDGQEQSYDALVAMQTDYARVVSNLVKAEAELLQLSKLWSESEAKNAHLQANITYLQAKMKDIGDINKNNNASYDAQALQKKLNDRHQEIASLTKMLKFSQHQINDEHKKYEWMRNLVMILIKIPRWWHILPKNHFNKRKNDKLINSNLFDMEHYINKYPDVAASNIDPLKHYIFHGINENRSIFP